MIHGQTQAKVRVNNLISDTFSINRGTRHRCPLFPLLFTISIEPLANLIWTTSLVEGVKIGQKEFKIGMFADNVILYLANPSDLLDNIDSIFKSFKKVSGLHINTNKFEIHPIHFKKCNSNEVQT